MSERCVADLFARLLQVEGIDCVFTVPGGTALPLLAAIGALGTIRVVVGKDETGAAFMAEGHASESGKPGVVVTIGGPGATNTLTALCCGAVQGNPLVLISAEVSTALQGRHPAQDGSDLSLDVTRMTAPATALSCVGSSADKACFALVEAFRKAVHSRRPVHVSIPMDVQRAPATCAFPSSTTDYRAPVSTLIDYDAVQRAARILKQGGRTALLIGRGARHAAGEILALSEALRAPVATTCGAKGVFPETHPLSLGVFSFGSGPLARAALTSGLDVLCAVGTGLGEFASMNYDRALTPKRALIHVDVDPSVFARDYACVPVCGDAKAVVGRLALELEGGKREAPHWLHELELEHPRVVDAAALRSNARPIRPERLMAEIQTTLPEDARVVADIGTSCLFVGHYLQLAFPQRAYIPMGWSCMAHPLAASIGIRLASDRPTLCVTGDGAFLAKGLELHAAVEARLSKLVWVVLSNRGHGLCRIGNTKLLGENHGVESGAFRVCPDAAAIARAVGARGISVREPSQLQAALCEAWSGEGPVVIDVEVDPEAEPPMADRVQGLLSSLNSEAARAKAVVSR
jgi:acetolactate synthase I/II/III large subunit